MTKYGMASSQVSSVTSPESGGRSEIPNLGGNDSSPILITGHKLNGHNYLQWSQSVLLFICDKGKDEYLTGEAAMPETTEPGFRKWKIENNMIMSWLINSMNNDMGENFLLFGTAKDIWDAAKETYSSSENISELFQVESALHDFRQGEQSVTQYYNTLTSNGGDRQKRDRPWCDYCKKLGHYKEACWKLHGKPADWKPKPRSDRDGRAHVAANSESTSVPEPSPFNKEQMEMLQKLLSQVGSGSTIGIALTTSRGGMKPWIVDTGLEIGEDDCSAELCSGLYSSHVANSQNQVSQASCVQSQKSPNPSQFAPTELSTPMPSSVQPAQHTNVPSPVTIQSPMPIQPIAPQLANENLQVYIRRRKRQELEHGSQSTCGQYIDSNSSLPERT
ncbi:hypothetical protein CK203_044032 [Vitis vinifera]|uniref:Retrotransposon Copia-like N-terminal domain-containing protein n=1 Tax=Vitis vinifera TaxID=29760 RepID=A0A438HM80_VITVI|nr:hypothetical protein CK203_044032 [Vitis vinifera]